MWLVQNNHTRIHPHLLAGIHLLRQSRIQHAEDNLCVVWDQWDGKAKLYFRNRWGHRHQRTSHEGTADLGLQSVQKCPSTSLGSSLPLEKDNPPACQTGCTVFFSSIEYGDAVNRNTAEAWSIVILSELLFPFCSSVCDLVHPTTPGWVVWSVIRSVFFCAILARHLYS